MTNIYEMFETNDMLEQQGIWVNYGSAGKFLVARSGGANTHFAKVLEMKMRPYRKQTLNNEVAADILMESFVEAALLGWDGVKDRKGKAIKFSKENAIKLFKELPDLFSDLREQSSQMSNYQYGDVEDDAGN